jgi:signal transduction histidine kinase
VEEVDRLDNVIADVLDFARRAAPKWQEVDLGQVIRQTMDIVGAGLHRAEVALSVEIEENMPHLRGDPAQLKQVFLNICQNALKAMPEGGALGVIAACKSGTIQVSISDTGQGIRLKSGNGFFSPFSHTRRMGPG